jgi:hypothetical protein
MPWAFTSDLYMGLIGTDCGVGVISGAVAFSSFIRSRNRASAKTCHSPMATLKTITFGIKRCLPILHKPSTSVKILILTLCN